MDRIDDKLLEIPIPDHFLDTPALYIGYVSFQHAGPGLIHRKDHFRRIHGNDAFGHARQNRLILVALADNGLHPAFQVPCHAVHGVGKISQFHGTGHRQPMPQFTPGKKGGPPPQIFHGPTDATGHEITDARSDKGNDQPANGKPDTDSFHFCVNFRQGQRCS